MRARKPIQRKKSSERPERLRYLIYCEDEKAGVDYFKGIRCDLRAQFTIGNEHGEPLGLIKAAISHKERAPKSREDRFAEYDEVWCIIDVEAPRQHESLDRALRLAAKHDIGVAFANPCFELWVMLHFKPVGSYYGSKQIQKALEDSGQCGYRANDKAIEYNLLRGRYSTARSNAIKLRHDPDSSYRSNPWTDIDELVERLIRNCASNYGGVEL